MTEWAAFLTGGVMTDTYNVVWGSMAKTLIIIFIAAIPIILGITWLKKAFRAAIGYGKSVFR